MTVRARIAALHDRLDQVFADAPHAAVGRKIGVSHKTVMEWRARRREPHVRCLILIADAYLISLDWLVLGVGDGLPDVYRNPSLERTSR